MQISETLPHNQLTFPSGYYLWLSEGYQGAQHSGRARAQCVTGLAHTRCPSPSQISLWLELSAPLRSNDTALPRILLPCVSWTQKGLQTDGNRQSEWANSLVLVGKCGGGQNYLFQTRCWTPGAETKEIEHFPFVLSFLSQTNAPPLVPNQYALLSPYSQNINTCSSNSKSSL